MSLIIFLILFVLFPCPLAGEENEETRCIEILSTPSNENLFEKVQACERLAILGTDRCVPILSSYLSDPYLSCYSRSCLEGIPGPAAAAALRRAMNELEGELLLGVIHSVGVRQDAQAVDALSLLLSHEDLKIAAVAASALARIATPKVARCLMDAFASASPEVLLHLADAILTCAARIEPREAIVLYDALCQAELPAHLKAAAARGAVLSRGKEGIELFLEFLLHDEPQFQNMALGLARTWGGEEITQALIHAMDKLSLRDQVLMIDVFLDRRDALSRDALLQTLASQQPRLRVAALRGLGILGDDSCVQTLMDHLAAPILPEERDAAASSLSKINAPIDDTICLALPHAKPEVKIQLMRILTQRRSLESVPFLMDQAREPWVEVSLAAFTSLAALAPHETLPKILSLLLSCPPEAMDTATEILATVASRNPDAASRAAPIVVFLQEELPVRLRSGLLKSLGRIGNQQAYDTLREALEHEEKDVQDSALRALLSWHDTTPTDLLLDVAGQTKDPVKRTLALRGASRMIDMPLSKCSSPSPQLLSWLRRMREQVQSPEEVKLLLSRLASTCHPDALDMAASLLDMPEARQEACLAVVQIAGLLTSMGPSEGVRSALHLVSNKAPGTPVGIQAEELLARLNAPMDYLLAWQVNGPYMQEGVMCEDLYPMAFGPEQGQEPEKWQWLIRSPTEEGPGRINLLQIMDGPHRVAYARTWLISPEEQPARLGFGFDDGGKAWLNGQVVCEANTSGAWTKDQHIVDVTLRKGENLLFLKLTQHSGPWEFSVRVFGLEDKPLNGLQIAIMEPVQDLP